MSEPLELDDRVVCASTQVGMEMASGVMTARRLGEVASGWAEDGDAGEVLAAVWAVMMAETRL